jgi:hypothetical protein
MNFAIHNYSITQIFWFEIALLIIGHMPSPEEFDNLHFKFVRIVLQFLFNFEELDITPPNFISNVRCNFLGGIEYQHFVKDVHNVLLKRKKDK